MKTRKKIAFKIFQWLITAMVALIILIPIYWIFTVSYTHLTLPTNSRV